jgi:uncharacterized protein YkwD
MYPLLFSFFLIFAAPQENKTTRDRSPLEKYSNEWRNPKYRVCNTAANATYMTEQERQMIYILNLARMNPKLFCESVVKKGYTISQFIDTSSEQYYKTLVATLSTMQPTHILYPDSLCMVSARCHAITSGKKGYTGHTRQSDQCKKKKHFMGECCNYGTDDPLETILLLLIDSDVPDFGHRNICLGYYNKLGVAIAPHKAYGYCTVMDFY